MSIADKLTTIAENTQKVYDAGKQAEYDRFWDSYQMNGERKDYNNAFRFSGWSDETYNPKYEIKANGLAAGFASSTITDTKVNISVASSANQAFQTCTKLQTIRLLTVTESVTYANCFQNCTALENVTFAGVIGQSLDIHWSTLLTHDSLMSIINALKDGGTGTLTLGETNLAKLTEAEKAIATGKGWTLA